MSFDLIDQEIQRIREHYYNVSLQELAERYEQGAVKIRREQNLSTCPDDDSPMTWGERADMNEKIAERLRRL